MPVAVLIDLNASSMFALFFISFSIFFLIKQFHNFYTMKLFLISFSVESLFSFAAASAISCYLLIFSILLYTDSSLFLIDFCKVSILSYLSFYSNSMFLIRLSNIPFDCNFNSFCFLCLSNSDSHIKCFCLRLSSSPVLPMS
jgi:hypothetical protein